MFQLIRSLLRLYTIVLASSFTLPFSHIDINDDAPISSIAGSNHNEMEIDERLKRKRRKFLIGDLSCMKADFVQAPKVANADIKYVRYCSNMSEN
jgi:hypothetical protein